MNSGGDTQAGDLLRALVDAHSERIDVEYKNWLPISEAETRAKLAKHLCALANAGGGYLVFGKDDGRYSQPHPDQLDTYSHNAVNGIVKAYLSPVFECVVQRVTSAVTGKEYPVVQVPPHGTAPVCAKRDGPQDSKGRPQGVQQGVHYTRVPGPERAPVNTVELWRPIIHRCVINERTSLLASISRLFDRPVETEQARELDRLLDDLLGLWQQAEFSPKQLVDPRSHYCAFGFRLLTGDGTAALYEGKLVDFRRLIEELVFVAEQAGEVGWQLFGIHEVDAKPSVLVMGDAEAFQAVMTSKGDRALNAPAIWRITQDGRGIEVRGYHEDSWWLQGAMEEKRGRGSWQPGVTT